MSIYADKTTGRLFIQFVYQGQTIKRRLPEGTTKAQATKLETKLKNDLFFDNAGVTESKGVLWESFVDRVYLEHVAANHCSDSLDRSLTILKASMPFFKGRTLESIKPADVERFKTSRVNTPTRLGKKRMAATIHREMSIISRVFSLAMKNDLVPYNPCSRVEMPKIHNIQNRILADEHVDKFLASFRNSLQRDICTVVLYTGLRQKDVLGLSKKHINLETFSLIQHKTDTPIENVLHPKVAEIIARRWNTEGDLLFPSYRTGKQLKSIKNAIRFACIRAGIPILGIRDLRRTFGTQLHENGFDDKTVADCLGHSDLRTVHRYKRGTKIQKEAILSLEYKSDPARKPTSDLEQPNASDAKPLETLVEMRRVELLASALRTPFPEPIIH